MGRADVTMMKDQRIFAALRALPRGTGGPVSVKPASGCEVHYHSPTAGLYPFPTRDKRGIARTRPIPEHSRALPKDADQLRR